MQYRLQTIKDSSTTSEHMIFKKFLLKYSCSMLYKLQVYNISSVQFSRSVVSDSL